MYKILTMSQSLLQPLSKINLPNFSSSLKINFNFQNVIFYGLVALNGFLFFSYIYGVNANTSQGYEMKVLQNKIEEYTAVNKKLNLKASEISSIIFIQSSLDNVGFVNAGNPKFVEAPVYTMR